MIVFILIVVSISIWLLSLQTSPREFYKQLIQKSKSLENVSFSYGITTNYNFETPSLNYTLKARQISEIYKTMGKSKIITSINSSGMTGSYNSSASYVFLLYNLTGNKTVCSGNSINDPDMRCRKRGPYEFALMGEGFSELFYDNEKLFDNYEKIGINYLGDRSYFNRSCHEFLINISSDVLNEITSNLSYAISGLYSPGMVSRHAVGYICLNQSRGFIVHSNISLVGYDEFGGIEYLEISIGLNSFNRYIAKEKDFILPNDFDVDELKCEENKIQFKLKAFNDISGNISIRFGEYDGYDGIEGSPYYISHLDVGILHQDEDKKIQATLSKGISQRGLYIVVVCSQNGNCMSDTCNYYPISEYVADSYVNSMLQKECHDSDGDDLKTKGNVTYTAYDGSAGILWDICANNNKIVEAGCENSVTFGHVLNCTNGCENGACR
ncbi:MAG: hypothetical protein HZB67_03275 [Candidatus Aenigmarchaeota archaeon]|nr:hypothetical protein [Candidatus Aenigmarchaeota archaeon]